MFKILCEEMKKKKQHVRLFAFLLLIIFDPLCDRSRLFYSYEPFLSCVFEYVESCIFTSDVYCDAATRIVSFPNLQHHLEPFGSSSGIFPSTKLLNGYKISSWNSISELL